MIKCLQCPIYCKWSHGPHTYFIVKGLSTTGFDQASLYFPSFSTKKIVFLLFKRNKENILCKTSITKLPSLKLSQITSYYHKTRKLLHIYNTTNLLSKPIKPESYYIYTILQTCYLNPGNLLKIQTHLPKMKNKPK